MNEYIFNLHAISDEVQFIARVNREKISTHHLTGEGNSLPGKRLTGKVIFSSTEKHPWLKFCTVNKNKHHHQHHQWVSMVFTCTVLTVAIPVRLDQLHTWGKIKPTFQQLYFSAVLWMFFLLKRPECCCFILKKRIIVIIIQKP